MIGRIVFLVFLRLLYNPLPCSGQDSIATENLDKQKELKVQYYFFKALSEKAIKNLELCNEIVLEDISVLFEFSKNYLMLSHSVSIHKNDRNYLSAITI